VKNFESWIPLCPLETPSRPAPLVHPGLSLGLGAAAAAVMVADRLDGSFHPFEELRAISKLPVLVTIPLIGATRPDRPPLWLRAAPIAIGLGLVVLVSYHLASGNDQLAFLFSRGTP